jgi:Ca2+-binding RTX toxin-like protein
LIPWVIVGLLLAVVFTAMASAVTLPPDVTVDEALRGTPTANELAPDECSSMDFDDWVLMGTPDPGGTVLIIGSGADDTYHRQNTNNPACIVGGDGDDEITGGRGDDIIVGGAGDDIIYSRQGNDTVYGGDGNDIIYGGQDEDELHGGDGDDTIYGDQGNDVIYGDDGEDTLNGEQGDDTIYGGGDDDDIDGGQQTDECYGNGGTDIFNRCETEQQD